MPQIDRLPIHSVPTGASWLNSSMKELKETQQETDLETNMRKMPELQTDLEKPDILTFKTIKNDDERGRKVTRLKSPKKTFSFALMLKISSNSSLLINFANDELITTL